jgi:cell fate regulator YaaT (PSP1 superfamily)
LADAAMEHLEYLLSYGCAGDFGRFRAAAPLALRRGEQVVVRSGRGMEVGRVLRPATARHATFLPNTTVGRLLRRLTPADEAAAVRLAARGRELFARGRALVAELGLPMELLDAEVLLDGENAALHVVRFADCDVRDLVSALSREAAAQVHLIDLGGPAAEEHDEHGCGRCGSAGGCGSCGSGGCGSCGSAQPGEVQAYFAGLREQMERGRVPLV